MNNTMNSILIKNGIVVDPANDVEEKLDVLIEDGKIAKVASNISDSKEATVLDARGKHVVPGLIDLHVHFREPGGEAAETIATGAASAVAGGFTTVCCMPNTKPALDNEAQIEYVLLQSERAGLANVLPISAVTKGRQGKELTEMGITSQAGAVAFSDDGSNIDSADTMKKALAYAHMFNKVIMVHAEDNTLAGKGVMNTGFTSMKMGLPSIPAAAEEVIVARDIILSKMTGGRVHIAHLSSAGSVEIIREAKKHGLSISCETAPHYFTFCDEDVEAFETNLKMNPPLGSQQDRKAIIEGLKDGTIEVIASDHAPHTQERKSLGMIEAPFGVIGLETMLPICYTELVEKHGLPLSKMIAMLTVNPARILGIDKGTLTVGMDADLSVLDLQNVWTIDKNNFKSKSRNCPFDGMKVTGRATDVFVGGRHFQNAE